MVFSSSVSSQDISTVFLVKVVLGVAWFGIKITVCCGLFSCTYSSNVILTLFPLKFILSFPGIVFPATGIGAISSFSPPEISPTCAQESSNKNGRHPIIFFLKAIYKGHLNNWNLLNQTRKEWCYRHPKRQLLLLVGGLE